MYGTRWSEEQDAALKFGIENGFSSTTLSRYHAPGWRRTVNAVYQRAQALRLEVVAERATEAARTMRHGKERIRERLIFARVDVGIVTESDFSEREIGRRFMAWGDRVIDQGLSEDEAVVLAEELDGFLADLTRDSR